MDNDGEYTKPSLFPEQRIQGNYIKIWTKIENTQITPYINSKKSIFDTLGDNYEDENTDISTNFILNSKNI